MSSVRRFAAPAAGRLALAVASLIALWGLRHSITLLECTMRAGAVHSDPYFQPTCGDYGSTFHIRISLSALFLNGLLEAWLVRLTWSRRLLWAAWSAGSYGCCLWLYPINAPGALLVLTPLVLQIPFFLLVLERHWPVRPAYWTAAALLLPWGLFVAGAQLWGGGGANGQTLTGELFAREAFTLARDLPLLVIVGRSGAPAKPLPLQAFFPSVASVVLLSWLLRSGELQGDPSSRTWLRTRRIDRALSIMGRAPTAIEDAAYVDSDWVLVRLDPRFVKRWYEGHVVTPERAQEVTDGTPVRLLEGMPRAWGALDREPIVAIDGRQLRIIYPHAGVIAVSRLHDAPTY